MSDHHPFVDDALDRLGVPDPTRALIIERHGEPHRHYHTLCHIDLMLRQLPANHAFRREMMAATLFHDIIYDPARADNEDLSLELPLRRERARAGSSSRRAPGFVDDPRDQRPSFPQ